MKDTKSIGKANLHASLVYAINRIPDCEFIHYTENLQLSRDYERALPCMSFRITVKGGDDKAIAKVIWDHKPISILSMGNTKVKIKDSMGFKHKIYFEKLHKMLEEDDD